MKNINSYNKKIKLKIVENKEDTKEDLEKEKEKKKKEKYASKNQTNFVFFLHRIIELKKFRNGY